MPPLSPAMAPPVTSIAVRSESRFLPSESATVSLSRMARSDRPYGGCVIRRTNQNTTPVSTTAPAPNAHWYPLDVVENPDGASGAGIRDSPASPFSSGR